MRSPRPRNRLLLRLLRIGSAPYFVLGNRQVRHAAPAHPDPVGLAPGVPPGSVRRAGDRRGATHRSAGPQWWSGDERRARSRCTATSRSAGRMASSTDRRRPRPTSTRRTTASRGTCPSRRSTAAPAGADVPTTGRRATYARVMAGGRFDDRVQDLLADAARRRGPWRLGRGAGPGRCRPRPRRPTRRGAASCWPRPTRTAPVAGERRQLTVLFSDVVGSTAFSQRARSRARPRGAAQLPGDL